MDLPIRLVFHYYLNQLPLYLKPGSVSTHSEASTPLAYEPPQRRNGGISLASDILLASEFVMNRKGNSTIRAQGGCVLYLLLEPGPETFLSTVDEPT